jgi:acyl-CoA synthetase (NDP forming)
MTGSNDGRPSLDRVLNPKTVAIVGITESSGFADSARRSLQSDAEVVFVHPRAEQVFGRPTYRDLASIPQSVDAVLSCVSADRTVGIVHDAGRIGAGGVVAVAGGYAELGGEGFRLQEEMAAHARAAGMPIIGPNGVGLMNVPRGLDLCILVDFPRRSGGLSLVMHSGAMIAALGASAWRAGGIGLNLLISAGNEAVTDMADYLDYLAGDDATRVIGLAVEKIRRPDAFFAAAARCREAGKPIVALKVGRSERSQRMAASHTGTLTGDAWIYDVAFAQAGIFPARDIDDMVDRLQFLEQLPPERWTPVRGLAILTGTGGFAQLAGDLAEEEGISVPEAPRLREFSGAIVPGCIVPNPLDVTGFINGSDDRWDRIVGEYADAPEFDTYLFASQHADWDRGERMSEPYIAAARASEKAFVIAPLAGIAGDYLDEYRNDGVAVGNGLRGSLRGIATMGRFLSTRSGVRVAPADSMPRIDRPPAELIPVAEGRMLPFAATMDLLTSAGIPVAPHHLIGPDDRPSPPSFDGPYVVKLADVAHRTERGAVRIGVPPDGVVRAVDDLRAVAAAEDLPAGVVVQPLVDGHGEAFVGLRGASELGPVVIFGLGGVFVEVLKRVGGRMAPMSDDDADELVAEFDDLGVVEGFRGAPAWDRHALREVLTAAGQLAAGGRDWIDSIDINPLVVTATGLVAVDGLCLVR